MSSIPGAGRFEKKKKALFFFFLVLVSFSGQKEKKARNQETIGAALNQGHV